MSDELAVDVLFAAARRLPAPACELLAQRLVDHLIVVRQNDAHDLSPLTPRHERAIGALRAVAESLGHVPTTTEYQAEYDRRRTTDKATLPSVGAIVREFGGWGTALGSAGLVPAAAPSAFMRRRNYQRRIVHRYSDQRLPNGVQAQ